MTKKTTDVEAAPAGGLATFPVLAEVERWLTEPGYVIPWPEVDPAAAAAAINASILAGEDPLAPMATDKSDRDALVGISWQLRSVEFRPSEEDSGAEPGGAYAILKGVTQDGEVITLVTGATKVLARAMAVVKRGKLGSWVMLTRSADKTRSGYHFYDLVTGVEPFPES